jgi:putative DNA primase/helicase
MTPSKNLKKSTLEILNIQAKRLMGQGFKILPIKPPRRSEAKSGKTPMTSHGVHDATDNFDTFRRLVGDAANFNIGVATGTASNVIVIDVDPRNGGTKSFAALNSRLGPLPPTLTCESGDGTHLYFRALTDSVRKKILAPGVDLLGENCYAVAPPSFHLSGKRYRWADNLGLRDQKIASLPAAWRQFIQEGNREQKEAAAKNAAPISEGSRNVELTRIAGQLRRGGLLEAELQDVLCRRNKELCRPPLDDGEVDQIARSVCRYPVGAEPRDEGQKIAQALLDAEYAGGEWLRHEVDGHFWCWVGTHWSILQDKILKKKTIELVNNKFASTKSAKTLVNEVFELLQIMQARDDDQLHFASEPPNIVNTSNKELWLREGGRIDARPHSPATGMRHMLSVEYDPEATCPEYDAAIMRIFEKARYPQTLINFFNELMGYAIQLRRDIPLIVVMIGKGSNGKTSLVKLLIELVGTSFVHSGRVGELDEARFGIGSLFGKLLFVDDDVRAGAKLPDGALKKISEAKLLTGEHKFKPAFTFVNRAFPMLLCNNLPSLADLSPGMMRRIHVLPFDRSFGANEIDRELFDRIIKNELSGVLNRALQGWKHLKLRSGFRHSADMSRARHDLLVHANPLKGFIDECCEIGPKSKVPLQTFYDAYTQWCAQSGYSLKQTKSTVKKNLEHEGHAMVRHAVGLVIIGMKLRKI